eukprot:TRINITY_DN2931_c0_g1_i1.p1 TRINITY_DN2931_c0_g1~~TRINITY_DN2931_c0_g1_i1.p1  ORF type:complete len:167 (-),score=29.25 TRINITY_DN2931_c0_g1_i1:191-691(-)
MFRMLGSAIYNRYKDFAARQFVMKQGGLICPFADCNAGVMPDWQEVGSYRVTCPECHRDFCRKIQCMRAWHEGDCPEPDYIQEVHAESWLNLEDEDTWERSVLAAKLETQLKRCPQKECGVGIQNIGGCNEIQCTNCGLKFCWICLAEWKVECGQRHPGVLIFPDD